MKKRLSLLLAIICLLLSLTTALGESTEAPAVAAAYTLDRITMLSRHDLRAPLSSNGAVQNELSAHAWIDWGVKSSDLTLKGGVLETRMGQYCRLLLENKGFLPEYYIPEDGEVRFYANAKQRTQATARSFAAGMFPMADIVVERHAEVGKMDAVFNPVLHYYSESYAEAAASQTAAIGGTEGFEAIFTELEPSIRLLMDVTDMASTEAYKNSLYDDPLGRTANVTLALDKEPDVTGSLKVAASVADTLLMQYYLEPDDSKATFGYTLTEEELAGIVGIKDTYYYLRHGAPLVAVNVAHPVLEELLSNMKAEGRKFTFLCAHDVTIIGVLSALGVRSYTLANSLEHYVPIGSKLVFERYLDADGKAWYDVYLLYMTPEQIRQESQLTLDNPPMTCSLDFKGVEKNADGYIAESDLTALFSAAISAYDGLAALYPQE